jgi:hypothetical protein
MGTDGFRVIGSGHIDPALERQWAPLPPPPLIPIVFVPGIMGSNLRVRTECIPEVRKQFEDEHREADFTPEAWRAPNVQYSKMEMVKQGGYELFGGDSATVRLAHKWDGYGPKLRQVLLNPKTTEVDEGGFIPESLEPLRTAPKANGAAEARRRGWGGVHWDSYGSMLCWLENNLQAGDTHTRLAIRTQAERFEHQRLFAQHWELPKRALPTQEEMQHAAQFRFPVYAFGYNWTQSNLDSAGCLLLKIENWIAECQRAGHECRQVILVTHSMGGLVARAAAKLDKAGKQQILGIIHGVMPAIGAPVLYRRTVGGMEEVPHFALPELTGALVPIGGRTAAETTPVIANAPGCLELLPSHLYPPGWLRVERDVGRWDVETLFALPEKDDPYREIYEQKDAWWRLVDPKLLDPALIHSKTDKGVAPEQAWNAYSFRIANIKEFHRENLSRDDYHDADKTYVFYGEGHKTFATVRWRLSRECGRIRAKDIRTAKAGAGNLQSIRHFVLTEASTRPAPAHGSIDAFIAAHDLAGRNWTLTAPDEYLASLADLGFPVGHIGSAHLQAPDGDGDGTVPVESGRAPTARIARICRFFGFDHQEAYMGAPEVRLFTSLAICKLTRYLPCPVESS